MKFSLTITPKSIAKILFRIIAILLIANLISNYLKWEMGYITALGFVPMFDFDQEYNIPTLYSSLAILFSAFLLWWISIYTKKRNNPYALHWKVLSFLFVFLAIDEMTSLHNQFGRLAPILFGDIYFLNESRYWILAYLPFMLLIALFFFKFFLSLPNVLKYRFVMAGVTFVAGAVGVEIMGDQYMMYHENPDIYYGLLYSLEELLEMVGIVIFIHALVSYITAFISEPQLQIQMDFKPNHGHGRLERGSSSIIISGSDVEDISSKINV